MFEDNHDDHPEDYCPRCGGALAPVDSAVSDILECVDCGWRERP